MNQQISVVINTYNAEKYLARVLETASSFDEVVVCDMESTDGTVAIAQRYGCKVVSFPKANHKSAEPARTFAIQSASSDWVLVVDADELIPQALHDYLHDFVRTLAISGDCIYRARITQWECSCRHHILITSCVSS